MKQYIVQEMWDFFANVDDLFAEVLDDTTRLVKTTSSLYIINDTKDFKVKVRISGHTKTNRKHSGATRYFFYDVDNYKEVFQRALETVKKLKGE